MRTAWIGCMVMGVLLGAGCVQHQTVMERNWGRAFETARTRQILNPEAGGSDLPVEGLSGRAAGKSMARYEKSFEETQSQDPVVNILLK